MRVDPAVLIKNVVAGERSVAQRIPNFVRQLLLSVFGIFVATSIPILFVRFGIGMSPQPEQVAFTTASASLLAMVSSFLIIRRLTNFPLMRTYKYAAVTLFSIFIAFAVGLKGFGIVYSSPQFFLAMLIIMGLVEGFLYASRHSRPLHIAVVPGGSAVNQLPKDHPSRPINYNQLQRVPSGDFSFSGVIADLASPLEPEWEKFLASAALRNIPVYHIKQFRESITGRVALDHLWENSLSAIVPALIYPQFKRSLDLLGVLLLLPIIGLVIGVSAILVKLDTAGPIFYRHQRTGLGGRSFVVFKLRTMIDDHDGEHYTVPGDARVTRVGRFLRQYRIDELPQVINILRGEMSWIGPRPEAVSLAQKYEQEIPFYVYRHIVRPGISGWAQVHQGNVTAVDAARLKLEYDFFYIKHFSFWLDVVILIKSLRTIVTRAGAC